MTRIIIRPRARSGEKSAYIIPPYQEKECYRLAYWKAVQGSYLRSGGSGGLEFSNRSVEAASHADAGKS